MTKVPPPDLPDFIFLLSDHTTRTLACDVAKKLGELAPGILTYDFLMPIYEAVQSMSYDCDWGDDWGDPRSTSFELRDEITSLEKWYNDYHGEDRLGQLAYKEWLANHEVNDAPTVVRDATWTHIKPFLAAFKSHQYLVIPLIPVTQVYSKQVAPRVIFNMRSMTTENVVVAILEASK